MLWILLVIFVAGAVGGIVNALISDNGFVLPKAVPPDPQGTQIIRPGFLGNVLMGGVAAMISWGLYGSSSSECVVGCGTAPTSTPTPLAGLTLASLVGAVLVGIGGARWLTNEVDKKLLKATALAASTADQAARIAVAAPAEALEIARAPARP